MTIKAKHDRRDVRGMLTALGIGNYTASGIIPSVFMGVGTTDPASPPIGALVLALQKQLQIDETGVVDEGTAYAFEQVAGPDWEKMAWFDIINAAHAAASDQGRYQAPAGDDVGGYWVDNDKTKFQTALGGVLDLPSSLGLPDVPGGILTYGVAGYFLYRFLKNRKKAA